MVDGPDLIGGDVAKEKAKLEKVLEQSRASNSFHTCKVCHKPLIYDKGKIICVEGHNE